jgi:hypothetical protein
MKRLGSDLRGLHQGIKKHLAGWYRKICASVVTPTHKTQVSRTTLALGRFFPLQWEVQLLSLQM